jgi:hypothetical protein
MQDVSAALDTIHMTLIDAGNDRGSGMITSTTDFDSLADSSKTADDKDANNREGQIASRRYMDAINSLGRPLNLDRRDIRRERRVGKVIQYMGPARRKILDRRDSPGDRRKRRGRS